MLEALQLIMILIIGEHRMARIGKLNSLTTDPGEPHKHGGTLGPLREILTHDLRYGRIPRKLIQLNAVVELLEEHVAFCPKFVEFGVGEEGFALLRLDDFVGSLEDVGRRG